MQSKDEIELAVFESFREFLLAVRFFRLRLAVLLGELLDGFSLVHIVIYGTHNQHTIRKRKERKKNKGFIVEPESEKIKIWRQE